MFGKTYGFRSTAAAVAAALWGMAPLAAQAIGGPQTDIVTVAPAESRGCPPPMGGGEPITIAAEPRSESVKDAPFSGVGTTEIVTTLADGNRIVRTNTMKYYRDSRGRTRTEYSLAAIGPFTPDQAQSVVMITDPVEGKRYVLNSAKKRADIFPLDFRTAKAVAGEKGATGENNAEGPVTKEVIVDGARAAPGVGVVKGNAMYGVKAFAAGPGLAAGGVPPPMRGAGPPLVVMSNVASLPPANVGFIMQYGPLTAAGPDGCKNAKPLPSPTSMGERIIEGLKVTGTRMEFTIPSGAVGNEQPIVVSSEQWFSPELGVVVSSTHRDPMMGDTSYKLEQISRTEPDAGLFAVPADYTQTDLMNGGGVFFESGVGIGPPGAPPPGATMRMRAASSTPASATQKQGQ